MGLYSLSYSGAPQTDDEEFFVSAARNVYVLDELDVPQMYGNERLRQLGQYHGVEPAHPILASFIYGWATSLGLGGMQAVFLLNLIYTSITVVMVFLLVVKAGYGLALGVIVSAVFGLTTIAWPYAITFFREPLAVMFLCGSYLCFECLFSRISTAKKIGLGFGFLVLFVAAVLTKVLLAVSVIGFFIIAAQRFRHSNARLWQVFPVVGVLVTLSLFMLLSIANPDIFYRYSTSFVVDIWNLLRGGVEFDHFIVNSFLGPLFSPAKGLFIYSPALILVLFSLVIVKNEAIKRLVIFSFVLLVGLLAAQALVYGDDWFTPTWGTRYLLPAIPFLIVVTVPVIDWVIQKKNKLFLGLLIGLCAVGIVGQLGAILFSPAYYSAIFQSIVSNKDLLWSIPLAPLVGHWIMILNGADINLALWRAAENHSNGAWISVISISVGLVIGAVMIVILAYRVRGKWTLYVTRGSSVLLVVTAVIWLPFMMLGTYKDDTKYGSNKWALQTACDWIEKEVQPGDVLVVSAYLGDIWFYAMNYDCAPIPWYSEPISSIVPEYAEKEEFDNTLHEELSAHYSRIWQLSPDTLSQPILAGCQNEQNCKIIEQRVYQQGNSKVQVTLMQTPLNSY
jgi:hypothetical protein